ncbi:MAG: hypothetical protein OXG96_02520 [Acidobacteria bacterium]|nr:hypothetical protein [Acidobacteriota bacterium]
MSALSDFVKEYQCPACGAPMKVAPVWDFVLGKGQSACGHCWKTFRLKEGAQLDGYSVKAEDLELISEETDANSASGYVWNAVKLESSRVAAVDFFVSVAFTAFFDGLERNYPVLSQQDFDVTWRYLSQAGAFAVDSLDTRIIADAFEKVERYKPTS